MSTDAEACRLCRFGVALAEVIAGAGLAGGAGEEMLGGALRLAIVPETPGAAHGGTGTGSCTGATEP